MQNEIVISVKNISKKYNITHQRGGYIALRDVLANIIKNPFQFLKQKTKEATGIAKKEEFWALRDINFEVKKGEVVGIIGRNGAGKSTLLKILSQITPPTEGEIKINGRVGSLLEVGTGFHPELSGRENIFLNGAILGMTKKEIVSKFDEIVSFAGIEKFLDTPVKHYSSGMYVRLAFSVAAHMDPDILIIDEVLAVGDAEFQKKCLGKMDDITKKEGRTILFVSHNMDAVKKLCPKTILIHEGKIKKIGPTEEIISEYHTSNKGLSHDQDIYQDKNLDITLSQLEILNHEGKIVSALQSGHSGSLRMLIKTNQKRDSIAVTIGINSIQDDKRICVMYSPLKNDTLTLTPPQTYITCQIPKVPLMPGQYHLTLKATSENQTLFYLPGKVDIEVENGDFFGSGKLPDPSWSGAILVDHNWQSEHLK